MVANTVDSTPTTESAAEDIIADTHVHYDVGYKAAFAEIGNLLTQLADEISILRGRYDDEEKGVFIRSADKVGNDDAAIANRASLIATLKESGDLEALEREMASPTNISNMSGRAAQAIRAMGGTAPPMGNTSGGSQFNPTVATPGITTQNGTQVRSNDAGVANGDIIAQPGTGTGSVDYHSSILSPDKIRNKPIQNQLLQILNTAANAAGVEVRIFSAGQDIQGQGTRRTGSKRHDAGYAADVWLYPRQFEDGSVLDSEILSQNNADELAVIVKFIEECKKAGATAVGAGLPYMTCRANGGNGIHVDIADDNSVGPNDRGYKAPYWGGPKHNDRWSSVNAPQWLIDVMTA